MTPSKRGAGGAEVAKIQRRLHALGLFAGAIDGRFGGSTEAAVKAFQKLRRLAVDGVVGPLTWRALFRRVIAPPALARKPLAYKCLALTGSFETGGAPPACFAAVSGDFDGQGLSFGALQWNFGQRTLQALLLELIERHPQTARSAFHDRLAALERALRGSHDASMAFARSIQNPITHAVSEPWRGMFIELGRTRFCQDVQRRHAAALYAEARRLAEDYGVWSERAVALMFDIVVQNGGIGSAVRTRILAAFAALPAATRDGIEAARLRIIAEQRALAANPRWRDAVLARKLCIASGSGTVHGINYDLAAQFGIRLRFLRPD